MKSIPTVHELELMICRMDKSLRKTEHRKTRQAAVILMGAALGTLRQDVTDIQAKTGYKQDWIREVVTNIRNSHIWRRGKTHCDWFEKDGAVAFLCDVAVACGWLLRSK